MATKHQDVFVTMAAGKADDLALLQAESELTGWTDEANPNRTDGESDWVAYLPSCDRAVWITNSDPVWFDASSLEDAVEQVQAGVELRN